MKKLISLFLVLAASAALANPIDDNCPQHVIWGAPQIAKEVNNQYICHLGYGINYNFETKVAHFVVDHIKASDLVRMPNVKMTFVWIQR